MIKILHKTKPLTALVSLAIILSTQAKAETISGVGDLGDSSQNSLDRTTSIFGADFNVIDFDGIVIPSPGLPFIVDGDITIEASQSANANPALITLSPFGDAISNGDGLNGGITGQIKFIFNPALDVRSAGINYDITDYTITFEAYNSNNVLLDTVQRLGGMELSQENGFQGSGYLGIKNSSASISYFLIKASTEPNASSYDWIVLDNLIYVLASLGPSAEDTLTSMQPNSSAMKNAFNRQYSQLAYGLNHDCTLFDANNICVSVFGRQTNMSDSSYDAGAAGLVLAYKPHEQFRMGAYIDQTLSSDTTSGVELERSNPDVGVFGVWNQHANGAGLQLRAAANYGKRDVNVTRTVVGTAEAGSGKSDLNAYGALLEASYAFALNDMWSAKPYAGVRYLSIKRDSYTERSSDDVYNPLSYAGLEQETTSAIAGIRLNGQLTPKVIASLNVGMEHDLHHSIDDYRATGVNGLGSIDMDTQEDKTRPTAGAGISYDVAKKQRIAASVQYRKEIFMSESSTTGQVTYTIGF